MYSGRYHPVRITLRYAFLKLLYIRFLWCERRREMLLENQRSSRGIVFYACCTSSNIVSSYVNVKLWLWMLYHHLNIEIDCKFEDEEDKKIWFGKVFIASVNLNLKTLIGVFVNPVHLDLRDIEGTASRTVLFSDYTVHEVSIQLWVKLKTRDDSWTLRRWDELDIDGLNYMYIIWLGTMNLWRWSGTVLIKIMLT